MAVPLRMLWPHIGIRMYLLRRYLRFSRIITDREQAAFLAAPVSPRYGFEVSRRQECAVQESNTGSETLARWRCCSR